MVEDVQLCEFCGKVHSAEFVLSEFGFLAFLERFVANHHWLKRISVISKVLFVIFRVNLFTNGNLRLITDLQSVILRLLLLFLGKWIIRIFASKLNLIDKQASFLSHDRHEGIFLRWTTPQSNNRLLNFKSKHLIAVDIEQLDLVRFCRTYKHVQRLSIGLTRNGRHLEPR